MKQALLILFLALNGNLSAAGWVDRMTLAVCEALENPSVNARNPGGRYLSTEYLHQVVGYCYEAAVLNPSWGSREETAIKLLGSIYNESGFVADSMNAKNRNKTIDVGILQINSVHWKAPHSKRTTFSNFCSAHKLRKDMVTLWNPRTNILFAAYVNEMMCQQKLRSYNYRNSKRKDCMAFYDILKHRGPSRRPAAQPKTAAKVRDVRKTGQDRQVRAAPALAGDFSSTL